MAEINDFPHPTPSSSAPQEPLTPWNVETVKPQRERAALIARLLNHFWTAADHPAVRQAQIEDWLDDLREFDYAEIADACRDWRRGHTKRPTIAEIRNLCREAKRQPAPAKTDMDEYAQSVGWRDNAERMQAIADSNWRKRQRDAQLGPMPVPTKPAPYRPPTAEDIAYVEQLVAKNLPRIPSHPDDINQPPIYG
jgi:hypothetical protein